MSSYLEKLAEFAVHLKWNNLPEAVRERLPLVVLDTIGVIIAGNQLPENQQFAAMASRMGQPGTATILGTKIRANPMFASFTNALAGVSLELDEGNKYAAGHPSIHTLPVALALAEEQGLPGKAFLISLLVGYEVAVRISRATRLRPGVHPHGNWGTIGAAVAAARLAGHTATDMEKAINLAASLNMATHWQTCFAGGTVRNAWPGASAMNGMIAAHMVSFGFTGEPDGPATTYGALLGEAFDLDIVIEGIGKEFEVLRGYFKQHSCCGYNHPPIDALEQVLKEHPEIRPDQITQIVVETHSKAAALCDPAPETTLGARFSIPYSVAARILLGQCSPAAFTEEQIRDSRVRALAQRVTVVPSSEFDAMVPQRRGARVTVETADGRRYSAMLPNPVGDSEFQPFTADQLRDKFRSLVNGVIGLQRVEQAISLIESLGELEDMRKLTAVLV